MNSRSLLQFFRGTSTPRQAEQIKNWVEKEPGNENRLLKERAVFDLVAVAGGTLVRAELDRRRSLRRRIWRMGSVAAGFAIIAAAGGLWLKDAKSEVQPAVQYVEVPAGQHVRLSLPDGSLVWLNGRSTLSYPSRFGKTREVDLSGQAYFEVEHDNDRPFTVHTGKVDVEVLGTKFDVRAYPETDDFEAMLVEGKVRIEIAGEPSRQVTLHPETKVTYRNGLLAVTDVRDLEPYSWKEGYIAFSGSNLADIADVLRHTFDRQIVIEHGNMPDVKYSGKFRTCDGVEYALRVLQREMAFDYEYRSDDNTIYITKR